MTEVILSHDYGASFKTAGETKQISRFLFPGLEKKRGFNRRKRRIIRKAF